MATKIKTMNDIALSNVVSKKELRKVQQWTLRKLKEALLPSAGPYGSTTQILKIDPSSVGKQHAIMQATEYSKDGHTILSHIRFDKAIEDSLQKELTDITRRIVKTVGDGTTSVVILSSLIFDELLKLDTDKYPPYLIIETFQSVVEDLKKIIKNNARDLCIEDVYNIAMICTNSNKRVSNIIANIYKEHGEDVFIDVGASVGEEDVIKTYDGLTLDVGFSDPCYINRVEKGNKFVVSDDDDIEKVHGEAVIRNAHIYAFSDPIDTREMQQLFDAIIYANIIQHYEEYMKTKNVDKLSDMIPTVIMAPKISVDMGSTFENVVAFMHNFDKNLDVKPPLLIVTNISEINYETYSDIWRLCGCKVIKKYIDPEIQKSDIEQGKAPTPDTVVNFCGKAEEVKSDSLKTTFINPIEMFETDSDGNVVKNEDGAPIYSNAYTTQISFLESELQRSINEGADLDVTGNLRRRIHALKANMVDYYVGGVTVTDRDSVRALTEDAVKNIRSASKYGVGYGANFEGFRASTKLCMDDSTELRSLLIHAIRNAYENMVRILYSSVYYEGDKDNFVTECIEKTISENCPMNLKTLKFDKSVLCTIEQDMIILDSIAKIITIIFTTNQALTQTVQHNMYMDDID